MTDVMLANYDNWLRGDLGCIAALLILSSRALCLQILVQDLFDVKRICTNSRHVLFIGNVILSTALLSYRPSMCAHIIHEHLYPHLLHLMDTSNQQYGSPGARL